LSNGRAQRSHRVRRGGLASARSLRRAGRDGTTPIYGVIFKPTNFEAARRYPVIESITAGPEGSFVQKSFAAYSSLPAQAELDFIVVQIDGMGTSNSKAFHGVAWTRSRGTSSGSDGRSDRGTRRPRTSTTPNTTPGAAD
jgi:dipeptidyl aminopeptidase/acylaminoacyl peptidase